MNSDFLPSIENIFVADETIDSLIKSNSSIMRKLIAYHTNKDDSHKKIYLPPSVLKSLLENNAGETKAQIDNLFKSVISLYDLKATIIQELCLTAEMLKKDGKVILITNDVKLHQDRFKPALRLCGFSAILDFKGLDLFLS